MSLVPPLSNVRDPRRGVLSNRDFTSVRHSYFLPYCTHNCHVNWALDETRGTGQPCGSRVSKNQQRGGADTVTVALRGWGQEGVGTQGLLHWTGQRCPEGNIKESDIFIKSPEGKRGA